MTDNQTILILGGGVGGVVAANLLRKKLSKQHRIVLVEREEQHVFAPSLLWLMTGEREVDQISRPIDRLGRKGIEVIRGEVERAGAGGRGVDRLGVPRGRGASLARPRRHGSRAANRPGFGAPFARSLHHEGGRGGRRARARPRSPASRGAACVRSF